MLTECLRKTSSMKEEPDQHFETVSLLNYPGSVTTYLPDFPSRPHEIITTSVRTPFPAAYRWVEPRPNPYYSGKLVENGPDTLI